MPHRKCPIAKDWYTVNMAQAMLTAQQNVLPALMGDY